MTAQLYLISDQTSAANFRSWAEGISLQLTAAGWTKTSDTGQVNWTTNPAVPADGSYLYEIRQPASDPQQAGSAHYFKIEYGTSGTGPSVRISLGTGTNGAGTVTGFVAGPWVVTNNGSAVNTGLVAWECDFYWGSSSLGVLLWRNHSSDVSPCFFGIERTQDTSGTDNSDGVVLIASGNNIHYSRTLVFGIGAGNFIPRIPTLDAGVGSTSDSFNNNIPLSPVFPDYGKWGNPLTVCAGAASTDVVEGALITTTLYGASRTYLAARQLGLRNLGASATQALLMRFD